MSKPPHIRIASLLHVITSMVSRRSYPIPPIAKETVSFAGVDVVVVVAVDVAVVVPVVVVVIVVVNVDVNVVVKVDVDVDDTAVEDM